MAEYNLIDNADNAAHIIHGDLPRKCLVAFPVEVGDTVYHVSRTQQITPCYILNISNRLSQQHWEIHMESLINSNHRFRVAVSQINKKYFTSIEDAKNAVDERQIRKIPNR